MYQKRRSALLGAAVIFFALLLRLGGGITYASSHSLRHRPRQEPLIYKVGISREKLCKPHCLFCLAT